MATRQQARSSGKQSNSRAVSRRSSGTERHPADCQCPEHGGSSTRNASSRNTSSRSTSSRSSSRSNGSRTRAASSSARKSGSARRSSASAPGNGSSRSRSAGSRSRSSSRVLIDRDEIREWAEARNAQPSCVRGTGRNTGPNEIGIIRLDFPGYSGEQSLEPIEWEEWFQVFEDRNLALLVQDETSGGQRSNFNKLVSRESAEQGSSGKKRGSSSSRSRQRRAA